MSENEKDINQSPEQAEPSQPEPASPGTGDAGSEALAGALKVSFTFLKLAMAALVLFYVLRGIFYVDPQEVKFKLRFGRVVQAKGEWVLRPATGLYFRWPFFEEVVPVPTSEQGLNLGGAFWTDWSHDEMPGQQKRTLDVRTDGFLLTGDKNIVHMRLLARYQARSDPRGAVSYAFGVEGPEGKAPEPILDRMLRAATTKVVGSMEVMDVINRTNLFSRIESDVRRRLDEFERNSGVPLGIDLVRVEPIETEKVKNPTEPKTVSAAFYRAQNARSERDLLVQEGNTEATRIIDRAKSAAAEVEAAAMGDAVRLVRSAEADARAVERLLPIYRLSQPIANILRDRFYQRTIEEVMTRAPGAFVLHTPEEGSDTELRLMLGRRPITQTTEGEEGSQ